MVPLITPWLSRKQRIHCGCPYSKSHHDRRRPHTHSIDEGKDRVFCQYDVVVVAEIYACGD